MAVYILVKFIKAGITLWLILTLAFFASRVSGNAIDFIMPEGGTAEAKAALTRYYGLDASWGTQYLAYFGKLLRGEMGTSFHFRQPVAELYAGRFPATLRLCGLSMLLSFAVAVPLGILAAIRRKAFSGFLIQAGAFLGYAVPNFVLAILLLLVFSFHFRIFPSGGSDTWRHYVMPVAALSSTLIASLVRFSRSAMLDVLSQDYIRTARAKGVSEFSVISIHGLRNALITVVTVVGLQVAGLVSGAVVVESVFSWPGMGELLVFAAIKRDYPLLQSGVVLVGSVVILINFIVDIAYAVIDPAIGKGA
jgi:peptide/nickel transport system permease protein